MSIILKRHKKIKDTEILLPSSKSLSNRALIIRALSGNQVEINNLSEADDTQNLLAQLTSDTPIKDVGAAGTNMRFLLSYLVTQPGEYTLTGSERMQQRPIAPLVDSLKSIGAHIDYLKNEGYPPVSIKGNIPEDNLVEIEGNISSQFISSLLMIAPVLPNGLNIRILGKMVSEPYVEMTIVFMKKFGVNTSPIKGGFYVGHQTYQPGTYTVEADWSSAAFWYGIIATAEPGSSVFLKDLITDSLQGDKKCMEYFSLLHVKTEETKEGIRITKTNEKKRSVIAFHLVNEPDLFPVLAYTCAALKIHASFTGLQTLNLKESRRIEAVVTELEKTGAVCTYNEESCSLYAYNQPGKEEIIFNSYDDHRLAMAAAVFIHQYQQLTIHQPEVVSKSYPGFWNMLQQAFPGLI